MDPNPVVRIATASTLIDIVSNGGEDVYIYFVRDDVMTPLAALLKQVWSIRVVNFLFKNFTIGNIKIMYNSQLNIFIIENSIYLNS